MVSRSESVLITGGSGFTGRPLAARLRKDGYSVTSISLHASDAHALSIDLRDLDGLTQMLPQIQPIAIVHLAGIAAPSHSNIGELYSANVIGTANLFAAIEQAKLKPRIVIVASSAQLYAVAAKNGLIQEDNQLIAKTHYTISKRTTEEIAAIYSRNFPILVTRPFNYTGPGQSTNFLVPKIVRHFAEQRSEIRLGNLDLFRDFSDVGRVVEAYARLVSRPLNPTTVNICSGRAVHLVDILEFLRDLSGHRMRVISDSSLYRPDEPRCMVGSPARLEKLVGDLPNPEFSETLSRMYDAFRDRLRSGNNVPETEPHNDS